MAHFAEIDKEYNVLRVIVVNDGDIKDDMGKESELIGRQFCNRLFGGEWVQTSYNSKFRKQFAVVGGKYLALPDVFIPPKPFDSWYLDANYEWRAPRAKPNKPDCFVYWDEAVKDWIIEEIKDLTNEN